MVFDDDLAPHEKASYQKLCEDWFPTSHVRPRVRQEGVRVENKTLFLGCRAGPGVYLSNLAHEMGHFIECDRRYLLHSDWGMSVHQVEVMGRLYPEPVTYQCTQREIRVWVIQAKILEAIEGFDWFPSIIEGLQSAVWLPDICNVPKIQDPSMYSGLFSEKKHDESRLEWIWQEFKALYAIADIHQIRQIWHQRTALLKNVLANTTLERVYPQLW